MSLKIDEKYSFLPLLENQSQRSCKLISWIFNECSSTYRSHYVLIGIGVSRCPASASGITAEVSLCSIKLGWRTVTRKVTLLLSVVAGRISTNSDKNYVWRLYNNFTWRGTHRWEINANECCLLSRRHWFDRSMGKCSGSFSYSISRLFACIMLATYAINPTVTHGDCIFLLIFIFCTDIVSVIHWPYFKLHVNWNVFFPQPCNHCPR